MLTRCCSAATESLKSLKKVDGITGFSNVSLIVGALMLRNTKIYKIYRVFRNKVTYIFAWNFIWFFICDSVFKRVTVLLMSKFLYFSVLSFFMSAPAISSLLSSLTSKSSLKNVPLFFHTTTKICIAPQLSFKECEKCAWKFDNFDKSSTNYSNCEKVKKQLKIRKIQFWIQKRHLPTLKSFYFGGGGLLPQGV